MDLYEKTVETKRELLFGIYTQERRSAFWHILLACLCFYVVGLEKDVMMSGARMGPRGYILIAVRAHLS